MVENSYLQDMVAFSCCVFDGGGQEAKDMKAARERGWKGKFTKPGRTIRPGAIRLNGKCPLTPLEVIYICICCSIGKQYSKFNFMCCLYMIFMVS